MGKRRFGRRVASWLALAIVASGCSRQDADHLARIGRKTASRAEALRTNTGNPAVPGLQMLRSSMEELTLDARVSARLRWDKDLAALPITVKANGAVVELSGVVRDLNQRRRAVDLAQTTVGVDKVVDGLSLP
jgi:hypothetical protein